MKTPLVNVNRYRKGAFIEIMNNQVTDLREHVKVLKGICPMPILMERIGLVNIQRDYADLHLEKIENRALGFLNQGQLVSKTMLLGTVVTNRPSCYAL